jgi:hypothetical protein
MTSLNASHMTGQTTCGSHRSDEAATDIWQPQSLMLRMMRDASRGMAHSMGRNLGRTGAPRLDPQSMTENLRRDIGVIDWDSRERGR